jgi:hypothetical protein
MPPKQAPTESPTKKEEARKEDIKIE